MNFVHDVRSVPQRDANYGTTRSTRNGRRVTRSMTHRYCQVRVGKVMASIQVAAGTSKAYRGHDNERNINLQLRSKQYTTDCVARSPKKSQVCFSLAEHRDTSMSKHPQPCPLAAMRC